MPFASDLVGLFLRLSSPAAAAAAFDLLLVMFQKKRRKRVENSFSHGQVTFQSSKIALGRRPGGIIRLGSVQVGGVSTRTGNAM
jgi:hypothetical protein